MPFCAMDYGDDSRSQSISKHVQSLNLPYGPAWEHHATVVLKVRTAVIVIECIAIIALFVIIMEIMN